MDSRNTLLSILQILAIGSIPACVARTHMRLDLFGYNRVEVQSDGPQIAGSERVEVITSPAWSKGAILCEEERFDGTGFRLCYFKMGNGYKTVSVRYYSKHYNEKCRDAGQDDCKQVVTTISREKFQEKVSTLDKMGKAENFENNLDINLFAFAFASPIVAALLGLLKSKSADS